MLTNPNNYDSIMANSDLNISLFRQFCYVYRECVRIMLEELALSISRHTQLLAVSCPPIDGVTAPPPFFLAIWPVIEV